MLTAALAVLCALLVLVLLVQRPAIWPVLVVLAVLWFNTEFRTRLMKGEALLVPRVQKVLPGLDLQEARKVSGQLLNLADGVWSAHSSTVPGEAESMTLLVLNEETCLLYTSPSPRDA